MLRVQDRGEVVAEIPNRALTDEAPLYDRPDAGARRISRRGAAARPARSSARRHAAARRLQRLLGVADDRQQALGLPAVRPHGAHQHARAAGDGRRRRADQGHADGRSRCRSTATAATAISIRSAARCWRWPRRRATSRARARVPIGATNCLNFGNPERPEIMWQFARAVEGIGEACRALGIPITGGNVSLYNETDGSAIYPTPGHRRRRPDRGRRAARADASFRGSGDVDRAARATGRGELGGSEYLKIVHGLVRGVPPASISRPSARLQRLLVELAAAGSSGRRTTARTAGWRSRSRSAVSARRNRRERRRFPASAIGRRARAVRHAVRRVGVARDGLGAHATSVDEVLARAAAAGVPAAVIGDDRRRAASDQRVDGERVDRCRR